MVRGFERPLPRRFLKRTVLIVGEGERTEPYYFDGLKHEEAVRRAFAVTVKKGPGYTPEAIVREAVRKKEGAAQRGEEYDEIWCVLDVEGIEKRESLAAAVKLAADHDIRLALSNPAFEVWFLAHFKRTSQPFIDCRAVIQELNKHWNTVSKVAYDKDADDAYQRLTELTGTAIKNAALVRERDHQHKQNTADANSSTEVYKLVRHLLGQA